MDRNDVDLKGVELKLIKGCKLWIMEKGMGMRKEYILEEKP